MIRNHRIADSKKGGRFMVRRNVALLALLLPLTACGGADRAHAPANDIRPAMPATAAR